MLNISVPLVYCKVDWAYLTHEKEQGFKDCIIFGVASIPGHALLFHCQLGNGAIYYRLPIDKFKWRNFEDEMPYSLSQLQRWNCASADVHVVTFEWLYNQRVEYNSCSGTYLFTLDWLGRGTTAEIPHEHKCAHFIKLDNGQFGCLPNNFLLWEEPSNIVIDNSHKALRWNRDYPSVE